MAARRPVVTTRRKRALIVTPLIDHAVLHSDSSNHCSAGRSSPPIVCDSFSGISRPICAARTWLGRQSRLPKSVLRLSHGTSNVLTPPRTQNVSYELCVRAAVSRHIGS